MRTMVVILNPRIELENDDIEYLGLVKQNENVYFTNRLKGYCESALYGGGYMAIDVTVCAISPTTKSFL